MTRTMTLAEFVGAASYADVGARAREQLKIRLLDTLGVSLAALAAEPGGTRPDPAGSADAGGMTPERLAARYVGLGRQLDFQDVYVAKSGIRHPSASVGAVLAAAADASGADLLIALALAYAVETRLADAGSASAGRSAMCAGVGRVLGLNAAQMAGVLGAPAPSGLDDATTAAGATAAAAVRAVRRALEGGGSAAVADHAAAAVAADRWSSDDLDGVLRTIVRPYATDVYLQSAVDVALTVSTPPLFRRDAVRAVRVKTFQAACDAIGRDIDPSQRRVDSPVQARQSLAYTVAIALLDRRVGLAQFTPERIRRGDVQTLLHKVTILAVPAFTARFPDEVRTQIEIGFDDGAWYCTSASSFKGFTLQPMDWHGASEKFMQLAAPVAGEYLARRIERCVREIDLRAARDLLALLAEVDRVVTTREDSARAA